MSARVLECLTKYFTASYKIAQSFYFSFMSSCIITVRMRIHPNLDEFRQIFSKSLSLHSAMFAGPSSGPVCHLLSLDHTPTAGLSGAPGVSQVSCWLGCVSGSWVWSGLVVSRLPLSPIWVLFGSFTRCLGPVLWLLLVLCFT